MPYLHFETDENRKKMRNAISAVDAKGSSNDEKGSLAEHLSKDERLIRAYLHHSPPLHVRRTLDQFYYYAMDTEKRDEDQVVYRYCKSREKELRVFMVDQLWMWILGPGIALASQTFTF
jgi:hypothetical protein